MKRPIALLSLAGAASALLLLQADTEKTGSQNMPPAHEQAADELLLCDGESLIKIPPNTVFDRDTAQDYADRLMYKWRDKNPDNNWDWLMAAAPAPTPAPAPQSTQPRQAKQFEAYNNFSERDRFVWDSEFKKFVDEGNRIFHSADAFGGTVGISCDMCHPNAANTHPETYPKYQVQIQRVVLLRDMINWCLQHPTKAKPLADDDPRLRAMEAYIMAQRAGKVMEPNKH